MLDRLQFQGVAAVVTGAGAGIGQAISVGLGELGANVICADLDGAALAATLDLLSSRGFTSSGVVVDISDERAVATLVDHVQREGANLGALFNVAGTRDRQPVESLALADWEAVIRVNLTGAYLCSKALLPLLRKSGEGSIVNISSTYGLVGDSTRPAYCASKAGLINLSRQMAIDVAQYGIRVNAVCPGPVRTERRKQAFARGQGTEAAASARTLLGRMAEPYEIADAAIFLASRAASYIDGAVLVVDGGQTAHTGQL